MKNNEELFPSNGSSAIYQNSTKDKTNKNKGKGWNINFNII